MPLQMKVPVASIEIQKVRGDLRTTTDDLVVVEEPLEIRLKYAHQGGYSEKRGYVRRAIDTYDRVAREHSFNEGTTGPRDA